MSRAKHVGMTTLTQVTCPPWCVVNQETHLQDLPQWNGIGVLHDSANRVDADQVSLDDDTESAWEVSLWSYTLIDGTPAPGSEGLRVDLYAVPGNVSVKEARVLAEAILAACGEAES